MFSSIALNGAPRRRGGRLDSADCMKNHVITQVGRCFENICQFGNRRVVDTDVSCCVNQELQRKIRLMLFCSYFSSCEKCNARNDSKASVNHR